MTKVKQMVKCPHCQKFSAHPDSIQTPTQRAVTSVRAKMKEYTKPDVLTPGDTVDVPKKPNLFKKKGV